MRSAFLSSLMLVACLAAAARAADTPAAAPADEIATLVPQLGDADYAVRETAADRLAALGPAAADALLTAAETSDDVEVSLRAGWLIRRFPADALALGDPADPPAVAALLTRYGQASAADRGTIMHRLLRLDGNAGIEALARIVRLDRTAAGSRTAAALLVDEWQPGDPLWADVRAAIARGLGTSGRPTALFLRGLVDFSRAESPADRAAAITACTAAFARLQAMPSGEPTGARVEAVIRRTFRRGLIQMLVADGRREAALAEAEQLLVANGRPEADDSVAVSELVWLADHGLPEVADVVGTRWPRFAESSAISMYALAVADRRRGDEAEAGRRAAAAFDRSRDDAEELARRSTIARLLVRWGMGDWAAREYEAVLGSATAADETFNEAAMLFAEFLHDQEDHARAADVLRQLIARSGDGDLVRRALEMELSSVRSRMLHFESCAALARGDAAGRRRLAHEAVAAHPKDVDALIAVYRLPDNTPDQQADAAGRVARALEQIDAEIQALPDEARGYNEYAWLVANTEGDVEKATRYSRRSLEQSTDNASYLDTLAHCHAAAGRIEEAVRTQSLAHRLEPHGHTIRRNLERFRSRLPQP